LNSKKGPEPAIKSSKQQNKVSGHKEPWFRNFILAALLIGIGAWANRLFSINTVSAAHLRAEYSLKASTPTKTSDRVGLLYLPRLNTSHDSMLDIEIVSDGSLPAKGVQLRVLSKSGNIFGHAEFAKSLVTMVWSQPTQNSANSIQYSIPLFKTGSHLSLIIDCLKSISISDFKIELEDSVNEYTASEKRILPYWSELWSWRNTKDLLFYEDNAWADEVRSTVRLEEKEAGASINIDGYDPILMISLVFQRFVDAKLISDKERSNIEAEARRLNFGPQLGGNYVLRLNEKAIKVLLENKIIKRNEAQTMLNNSEVAGGDVISGYNVTYLDAEILNDLIQKHKLSPRDAQATIDGARYDRHWRKRSDGGLVPDSSEPIK
jgi:hypothetical protein